MPEWLLVEATPSQYASFSSSRRLCNHGSEIGAGGIAMHLLERFGFYVLLSCFAIAFQPLHGAAQQNSVSPTAGTGSARDGQHDFDFEIGTWKTDLKRLVHPLTGSTKWVECDGTTVVRKVWDSKANLVELEADCPGGHFEGMSLRLYNPQSHQWSLNFSNASDGTLSQPTIGDFKMAAASFSTRKHLMAEPSMFG